MFCAVNTIEPFILNLATIDLFNADEEWAKTRRPAELAKIETRFAALSKRLSKHEGDFEERAA